MIVVAANHWYHCKIYNPPMPGGMPFVTFEVLFCTGIEVDEARWSQDRDGLRPVTCDVEAMYLMVGDM